MKPCSLVSSAFLGASLATFLLLSGLGAEAPKASAPSAREGNRPLPLPTYICRKATGNIQIDGNLVEPDWRRADEIRLLKNSSKPEPLSPRTIAKMLWDDKYVYIAFVADDHDIFATMKSRDQHLWTEEVVEVFIGRTDIYLEIEVNPLNTLFDARIDLRGQKGTPRFDVDAIAKANFDIKHCVAVQGTVDNRSDRDERWIVELAIPHAALEGIQPVPPKPADVWRINLYRIETSLIGGKPKSAFGAWSPTGGWFHNPSRFGKIIFATGE